MYGVLAERRYRKLASALAERPPGQSLLALHPASTIRWTVMTLTPVSAAMARKFKPFARNGSARSGRTAAFGRPSALP